MRPRRTAASESVPEVTAADVNENEPVAADAADNSDHPSEDAPPPAPAAPKRRRRAPRAASSETTAAPEPDGSEPATPESVTPEPATPPDEAAAPEKPARTRRRGPAKLAKTEAPTPQEAEAAVSPEPEAVAAPPIEEASPETAVAPVAEEPRRTRGRRRQPKAAGTEAAAEAPVEAAEVAEPAAAVPPEEAPPRRTRGPRRPKTTEPAPAAADAEPSAPAYEALPRETLDRLPEARIALRKGVPELLIGDQPRQPLLFFANTEDPEARETVAREIRLAYDAGVRLFTILAHLPWKTRAGERRFEPLDEALAFVAENAPEGLLLPRLIFSPPASWERAHPEEMSRSAGNGDTGDTGDVSFASHAFWEAEADPALRAAVEHVAQGPHAGRVFGFYLEHGEWFHEAGRGYDVSEPNRTAFRAWLRIRYKNDVIALRAAWHDGDVTFDTAEIPEWRGAAAPSAAAPLVYGERERRWSDFHAFSSDLIARVIARLARAVKEASGGRSVVAVSYGYTLELMRANTGHSALAALLASPDVDILTGPYSYSGRTPGGSAPLPAPVASVTLAGKLWISEDDTKTYRARGETPDTYNPPVPSPQDTGGVHARNFGAAQAFGAGVSWMDLWGQGWLDDPAIWEDIARLREIAEKLATRRRNPRTRALPAPDVAVLVDERSFFGVRAEERLLGRLVAGQRDALLRSGARLGFYLLSDLTRKNFPDAPRLLLFLNAFHLSPEVRQAIKTRFQGDGRTLAWVYGPGCQQAEAGSSLAGVAELADVIGMHLRLQPWGSRTGTRIVDARSPLTEGRRGQMLGEEERVNPSFTVADARAQILGEYAATGNPSLAVRRHETWQSVFVGEMSLTPGLLRGLYRLAGVPAYTTEEDVAFVGDSLLTLHSASGGPNTVVLPDEAHLFDLLSGETLARGGRGARLHLRPRETRLLFFGTAAEVSRLGGDPNAGPPGLTEAELPPPPLPFASEPGEAPAPSPDDVSPEDEALLAAALAADAPFADKDTGAELADDAFADALSEESVPAEDDAAPAAGKKKKRRRRGRRGRTGAEHENEPGGAVAAGDDAEEAPDPEDAAAPETRGLSRPPAGLLPLSELLPHSEHLEGDLELPPLPDELLPLDSERGEETAPEGEPTL